MTLFEDVLTKVCEINQEAKKMKCIYCGNNTMNSKNSNKHVIPQIHYRGVECSHCRMIIGWPTLSLEANQEEAVSRYKYTLGKLKHISKKSKKQLNKTRKVE